MNGRALVVAPHPDDEVLGVGGTIARMVAAGTDVWVVIMTMALAPRFGDDVLSTGRREARAAHEALGVSQTRFLPFPAAGLDTAAHADVNDALLEVFREARPSSVFVPFNGDLHRDHQESFVSALVCSRPSVDGPRSIYAYETLSETNWNAPYVTPAFLPNVFVDISDHLGAKLEAMSLYRSQLRSFPSERSIEALQALATLRGATVGFAAAEAFVLLRDMR